MSRFALLAILALHGLASGAETPVVLFPVVKDGRWGFIDRTGRVVIAPRFDRAGRFSEGLAPVQEGATLGYVDASGRIALVPEYLPAGALHRPFSAGLAVVKVGDRYGFMDRAGKLAIPARFELAHDFSGGYAMVCVKEGCGYVDTGGRGVVAPEYMPSRPARGGMACVTVAMGMSRERVALRPIGGAPIAGTFEGCGSMSEGLVAVRHGGLWGYVDASGTPAIPLQFAWAGDFSDGLAPVKDANGGCGYVDRSGKLVIPARFRGCEPFSGGLARVDLAQDPQDVERVAFIDRSGKEVVVGAATSPPFDTAEDLADGLAAVGSGGPPHLAGSGGPMLGYVDAAGRYVWKPTR